MPKRASRDARPHGDIAQISTLLELLRRGAEHSFVVVTTSELGSRLALSQQAASLRLLELEGDELIERKRFKRGAGVRVTQKGLAMMRSFYSDLKGVVEAKPELRFRGRVVTGLREGAYYISLEGYRRQFNKLLGFDPYPGTLNLRLDSQLEIEKKRQLRFGRGLDVAGFEDGTRTYGPAKCFRARINDEANAAALVIARTHYDDTVLELISEFNLRSKLKLKDGDEISATVELPA